MTDRLLGTITVDPPSQSNPLPTGLASSLLKGSETHRRRMAGRTLRTQYRLPTLCKAVILIKETPLDNGRMTLLTRRTVFFWAVTDPTTAKTTSPLRRLPSAHRAALALCETLPPSRACRSRTLPHPTWTKTGRRNFRCINFTTNLFSPRRCYAWFLAVDQDENGQLSPEELRMLSSS